MKSFRDPVEYRASLGIRPFSPAWSATLKGLYGSPMTAEEIDLFVRLSGGVEPRDGGWDECFANVGRRGGKDDTAKSVALFEAMHVPHSVVASPGQRLVMPVITPLRSQAEGLIKMAQGEAKLPANRKAVARTTASEVEFKNGVILSVQTCDAVAVVGDTVPFVVCNEWSLWPGAGSVMPASVIESNLRPARAPVIGAPVRRKINIGSSYIKEGLAFDTFLEGYGNPASDILVLHGSTEDFNPNIDKAWLEKERRRIGDRSFAMHYLSEWQDAIEDGWFGDCISTCVDTERTSPLPRREGVQYIVAIDQAFSGDQFAICVAHCEERDGALPRVVVDMVDAWKAPRGKKLSVDVAVLRCKAICHQYGTSSLVLDQFSSHMLINDFARVGITARESVWNKDKPALYRSVRDSMVDGLVRLPNDPALIREFSSIRGKLLASGHEQIAGAGAHDDRVSAAVLAITEAMKMRPSPSIGLDAIAEAQRFMPKAINPMIGVSGGIDHSPPANPGNWHRTHSEWAAERDAEDYGLGYDRGDRWW